MKASTESPKPKKRGRSPGTWEPRPRRRTAENAAVLLISVYRNYVGTGAEVPMGVTRESLRALFRLPGGCDEVDELDVPQGTTRRLASHLDDLGFSLTEDSNCRWVLLSHRSLSQAADLPVTAKELYLLVRTVGTLKLSEAIHEAYKLDYSGDGVSEHDGL